MSGLRVLVTGGAGYIGSTVVSAFADAGDQPIVIDNLSRGPRAFLREFPCYVGDFADPDLLDAVFTDIGHVDVVVHCAGRTVVADSVADPAGYYRVNVADTVRLVSRLVEQGCPRLIWSSSAAVYGTAPDPVITEATPTQPVNPYAVGKLFVERMLTDVCGATALSALSLRYFNPIGTDPQHRTGPYDAHASDVVGRLLVTAEHGEPFWINGCDWPTSDGTPVRDFVHVWDLARAHVAAAHRWPLSEAGGHEVINVGSGRGTSVRRLAETFNVLAARPVDIRCRERRAGDIAGGYASTAKAARLLGYAPALTVADGLRDALVWAEQSTVRSA